jgi:hypothetical protein
MEESGLINNLDKSKINFSVKHFRKTNKKRQNLKLK